MAFSATPLAALATAFEALGIHDRPSLVRATKPEFGDFQCNDMLRLAKLLGRNPKDLATELAATVSGAAFANVSVAGPGFVNIKLTDTFIAAEASAVLKDHALGVQKTQPLKIVIDFGGPNVAKALHVGHLRSFVIGESLRRILIEAGHEVVSDIHLGDWGLQMGKLLLGLAASSGWSGGSPDGYIDPVRCAHLTLDMLGQLYKDGNALCEDENHLALARDLTVRLQDGDPVLRSAWSSMRQVSLDAISVVADELEARFDLFLGESDAHSEVDVMLGDLVQRGLARESDGALVIDVSGEGLPPNAPPLLLRKSDGAALYGTTDLATLRQRVRDMGAQKLVYCTDDRQALHIASVFSAAKAAGYAYGVELNHVVFGTVRGPDGKPFKTREGTPATLDSMLQATVSKATEKVEDPSAATVVGIGALKFADLSTPRRTGYAFDIDRMTSFEGRTGPYLQYAYARICSILDKAASGGIHPADDIEISHPSERAVLVECLWYPHSLSSAVAQLEPFEIAERAFQIAEAFSRFYADCPVLSDPRATYRLATCRLVAEVLGRCLHLLGMSSLRRM